MQEVKLLKPADTEWAMPLLPEKLKAAKTSCHMPQQMPGSTGPHTMTNRSPAGPSFETQILN
jgi:hypothetical protein